jgi:hypothetical protein
LCFEDKVAGTYFDGKSIKIKVTSRRKAFDKLQHHTYLQHQPTYTTRKHSLNMRFSAIIISSIATLASAAPNELIARNNDQVTAAIRFAAAADDCSLLKCAEVIANAACIAAAIVAEPETGGTSTAAVIACVKEGLGEVCMSFTSHELRY